MTTTTPFFKTFSYVMLCSMACLKLRPPVPIWWLGLGKSGQRNLCIADTLCHIPRCYPDRKREEEPEEKNSLFNHLRERKSHLHLLRNYHTSITREREITRPHSFQRNNHTSINRKRKNRTSISREIITLPSLERNNHTSITWEK